MCMAGSIVGTGRAGLCFPNHVTGQRPGLPRRQKQYAQRPLHCEAPFLPWNPNPSLQGGGSLERMGSNEQTLRLHHEIPGAWGRGEESSHCGDARFRAMTYSAVGLQCLFAAVVGCTYSGSPMGSHLLYGDHEAIVSVGKFEIKLRHDRGKTRRCSDRQCTSPLSSTP